VKNNTTFITPRNKAEALEVIASFSEQNISFVVHAGGTDLVPLMKKQGIVLILGFVLATGCVTTSKTTFPTKKEQLEKRNTHILHSWQEDGETKYEWREK